MPPPSTAATPMVTTTTSTPSVLAAATQATPDVKTQDLQQAVDLFQRGTELAHAATIADDYVRAIEYFSIALAIRSDQPRFFFARGNAFRALNELPRAAADYTQAIALDDRTPAYYAHRGACFRKLQQPAKALEDLTAAIDMDSKKAAHYVNRAHVLSDHAFYKEAIIDLTRALEEGSAGIRVEFKALQLRGTCYRKLGQLPKCIEDLQRALQLDTRSASGFHALAQAYLETGALDDAIENFSNAIQLNATQASFFCQRGLCYYRQAAAADTSSAGLAARLSLADLNQAIQLDGRDPQAYFYRGSIRLALALDATERPITVVAVGSTLPAETAVALSPEEQLAAAFADMEMAWTLRPTGVVFQVGLAMITQLQRQYSKAEALFRDASSSSSANVVVKYHWALCCHWLGDAETALSLLSDCVEAIDSEPLFSEARALVLQEAGHHDLAIGDWRTAIALRQEQPRDAHLAWDFYLHGESHLQLEQFDEAIAYDTAALTALAETTPELEMSARNSRAMAHRGLGQYELAIDDLTACLRLAPKSDVFLYHRALCLVECERYAEALPDLHAALDAGHSDDTYLLYWTGLCYYHTRQNHECITFLERASTASSDDASDKLSAVLPDLHYRVGVAYARLGRNMDAVAHLTAAINCASTTASAMQSVHERAKALQLERYYAESIDDFTCVLEHNPHNAHAYLRRGFAFKALGQLHEAAADFESARQLDPKNPTLVVKYKEIRDTECVVLCAPGDEPSF